jgi:hypothetical protein
MLTSQVQLSLHEWVDVGEGVLDEVGGEPHGGGVGWATE